MTWSNGAEQQWHLHKAYTGLHSALSHNTDEFDTKAGLEKLRKHNTKNLLIKLINK